MSVGSNHSAAVDCLPQPADNSKEVLICHKKGGGSESTIIIGPSKSVLVYALHGLEKCPMACLISSVCAKIILLYYSFEYRRFLRCNNCCNNERLFLSIWGPQDTVDR